MATRNEFTSADDVRIDYKTKKERRDDEKARKRAAKIEAKNRKRKIHAA